MDDAFVIAEVLTSTDYDAAAEALDAEADRLVETLNDPREARHYAAADLSQMEVKARTHRAAAERFRRVRDQVRQQELKAVGL